MYINITSDETRTSSVQEIALNQQVIKPLCGYMCDVIILLHHQADRPIKLLSQFYSQMVRSIQKLTSQLYLQ